jgi:hypothetical protein
MNLELVISAFLFRTLLVSISFLSFAGIGCASKPSIQPDDLLIKDTYTLTPRSLLSSQEANHDVEVILYALKNGYGGRKYVNGVILDSALKSIDSLKNPSGEVSVAAFCEQIDEALFLIPDNHLSASIRGRDCSTKRVEPRGNVGKSVSAGSEPPWSFGTRKVVGTQIAILSINRFEKHEDVSWKGFLDAVAEAKKSAAIIIDLRGNPGGDDTMGFEMSERLFGGKTPSPIEFTVMSTTSASFAGLANNWKLREIRLKRSGKDVPPYIQSRLKDRLAQLERAERGELAPEKIVREIDGLAFIPEKGFAKPIYILIDRACGSSCESTLETFEQHPYVTTVGENTFGDIHFAEAALVILPNSQIQLQFGTHYTKYKDGRFVERTGYAPSVKVLDGQDALAAAIELFVLRRADSRAEPVPKNKETAETIKTRPSR